MTAIIHDPIASKGWKEAITSVAAGWGGAHTDDVAQALQFIYEKLMVDHGGVKVADTAALKALLVADIDALLTRPDTDMVTVTVLSDDDGEVRSYLWKTGDTTAENLPLIVAPDAGNGRWFAMPNVLDVQNAEVLSLTGDALAADADTIGNPAGAAKFATAQGPFTLSQDDRLNVRALIDAVGGQGAAETLTVRVKVNDVAVAEAAALVVTDGDLVDVDVRGFVRADGAGGEMSFVGTIFGEPASKLATAVDLSAPRSVEIELEWSAQDANHDTDLREFTCDQLQ